MIKMKMLITYSFEDDETRNSFIELLETLGCKNEPDQSTYSVSCMSKYKRLNIQQEIIEWSKSKDLHNSDNVCLYYPKVDEYGSNLRIVRVMCLYDKTIGSFRLR